MLHQTTAVALRDRSFYHANVLLTACLMQKPTQSRAVRCSRVHACCHRVSRGDFVTSNAKRRTHPQRALLPPTYSLHQQRGPAVGQTVQKVQLLQGWDAVRGLGEVSSVATEVFCTGDGFQPVLKLRKLVYRLELYARLGWRINKLDSCFAVARPADLQYAGKQAVVGVLEISLQNDVASLPAGQHIAAAVVTSMAVLPKLQRQGIGTAMLEAAQQWAVSQGAQFMALFVFRDNYPAIGLYESLGFERVPDWVDPRWLTYAEKGVVGPTKRVLYIQRLPEINS